MWGLCFGVAAPQAPAKRYGTPVPLIWGYRVTQHTEVSAHQSGTSTLPFLLLAMRYPNTTVSFMRANGLNGAGTN